MNEGSKKSRRHHDKTSVRGIDFPFLALRTNRKETRSAISAYLKRLLSYDSAFTDDMYADWVRDVKKLCALPHFFGFMDSIEMEQQRQVGRCFVCFGVSRGHFIIMNHQKLTMVHTYEDVIEQMGTLMGTTPIIPRSQGLIFQKKLAKRARRAILCWSMIARRLRIIKDIRVMIAKMVWNKKEEWMY